MNRRSAALEWNDLLAPVAVTAYAALVLWISPLSVIAPVVDLQHSPSFLNFERHFWQFGLAFLAVIILSRGHLWSYGINSQNLKSSMMWLVWLYIVTAIVSAAGLLLGRTVIPVGTETIVGGTKESVVASLVYWMSSPVANQILFFSLIQTVLMKQWGDGLRLGGIPLAVAFSSLLFSIGATTSHFGGETVFLLPTMLLGLFCGTVYWKTNSLITPMLGHAFFFGFPLFIHLLRTGALR